MSDDPAATLLLLLRLTAFAPEDRIASRLGWTSDQVARHTSRAARSGWIRHRDGMASGWSLTPEGRQVGAELLRAELDAAGTGSEVQSCYQGFLPLNSELLAVCTDWQTVAVAGEHLPNDHSDAARDAAVLDRLAVLHRRARPVLDALTDALDRFGEYFPRLERAHGHVRAGRTEWIAKPTVDSYHGIWFELHEHLLVTLGRERSTEPLPEYVPTLNGDST
jgi:hypothetical protein